MEIKVIYHNNSREITKVEKYTTQKVRIHPAGLIEVFTPVLDDTKYIVFKPTDLMDIFIEDKEHASEPSI